MLHSNRPPMWCLFQKTRLIRTNRLTGSDVRLGTAVLLRVCTPACLRVCIYVSCARAFTSLSRLHPLLTDSLRVFIFHTQTELWQRHYSTNTELPLITAVSDAGKNTPQKGMKAAQTNTQVRVDADGGGFRDC